MRDLDSGQVVELVGLPEHDEAGRGGRALDDRDGVVTDRLHHPGPALDELLGREVLLDLGVVLGAGAGGNQQDQEGKGASAHEGASVTCGLFATRSKDGAAMPWSRSDLDSSGLEALRLAAIIHVHSGPDSEARAGGLDYRTAGVDIDEADRALDRIRPLVASTRRRRS